VTTLAELPHVDLPFTQGLEMHPRQGLLVETSGSYPENQLSYVRLVNTTDGSTVRKTPLQAPTFIEGITRRNGRWFASTWRDKHALEFDDDLNLIGTHTYEHEGWGLARALGADAFLATNGSDKLLTLAPGSFELQGARRATCFGRPLGGLNELELVEDFRGTGPRLLGNVINTRLVVILDPQTAACTGVFHLRGLEAESLQESMGYHIANGIAYDKATGEFWVTGKNWRSLFRIRLSSDEESSSHNEESSQSAGQEAIHLLRQHVGA